MILELYKAYIWPVKRTENLPKRPKSDAFLGILLHSKCVTFWSDSVRQEELTQVRAMEQEFSLSSSLTRLKPIIQFESWRRKLTVGKYQKIYQWIKRLN